MIFDPIHIFLKVVEAGSFSKAAIALNMAPSSITRSVDKLEKELRTQLLKRSTRHLKLTENGQKFVKSATCLINDYQAMISTLSGEKSEPEGVLKISTFESYGRLYICPLLPEFLRRHPLIKVEIELENRVSDLVAEDIDIAIRIGTPQDSALKARKLLNNQTSILASPEYLARHPKIATPTDLAQHNCLVLNKHKHASHWYFKKQRRQMKVSVQGNLKSTGGTPLIETAVAGLGIIQIASWATQHYVNSGQLVTLLPDWTPSLGPTSSGDIYAIYKNSPYPNPIVRLFIDFLVTELSSAKHLNQSSS